MTEPERPDPEPPTRSTGTATPTLLEQMGGLSGLVASVVPIVVFVVLNAVVGFMAALWAALVSAVAIAVLRLVRRERLQPAISGAIGVGLCAFIAYRMGEAKGFFLLGIWMSLIYAALFVGSLLVRYPLVGVIWHGLRGDGMRWRGDRRIVRAYDVATATWAVVFVARFVVQRWLYDNDDTTALGVARLAMGLPLTAVATAVTVWAARRAGRLLDEADAAPDAGLSADAVQTKLPTERSTDLPAERRTDEPAKSSEP